MKTSNDLFPEYFPESWAESYGQDNYGLWQGVTIQRVEVRFRWMPPGGFMMGSPEEEPERWVFEGPQHRVNFAQGFWLAESACSQALWLVVMKKNPSHFQDNPENPVDNVGWQMAMEFIERINTHLPGLTLRLPTEAEWEYGCRAGTTTPFWFGDRLTTVDANYDGNSPYNNGEKGEYRKETMPVRSFRPNPWGLYQMHGNVWECCLDCWHAVYKKKPLLDGSVAWEDGTSGREVWRGGSWNSNGTYLRSACRLSFIDFDGLGLRLARGPEQREGR